MEHVDVRLPESVVEEHFQCCPDEAVGYADAFTVARQLTLPSGRRIDLLMGRWVRNPDTCRWLIWLYVVEIKAVKTSPPDLVQLCDYVWEVRRVLGFSNVRVEGVLVAPTHPTDMYRMASEMPLVMLSTFSVMVEGDGPADRHMHKEKWGERPIQPDVFRNPDTDLGNNLLGPLLRNHPNRIAVVPWSERPQRFSSAVADITEGG